MIRWIFNKLFPCKWGICTNNFFGCTCGTFIGLSAGTIGTAALLIGGGAYAASSKKKSKKDKGGIASPTGTSGYKDYEDYVKRSYEGKLDPLKTGFLESALKARARDTAKSAAAYGTARASAAGLGRSTLAQKVAQQPYTKTGLAVDEQIARLDIQDQMKRAEDMKWGALARKGIGETSAAQANAQAAQNYDMTDRGVAQHQGNINQVLSTYGGVLAGASGYGGGGGSVVDTGLSWIEKILGNRGVSSAVNIAGKKGAMSMGTMMGGL